MTTAPTTKSDPAFPPTETLRARVPKRNETNSAENPAARLLLQHFDSITETPEAAERLRASVFDLAVRGFLVPQNSKDESSVELLIRILDDRRRLARESVFKKTLVSEFIAPGTFPFVIPESWTWVKTRDITTYVQRGKSPKYSAEKRIPVIAQKCIQWHGFELHKAQFIDPQSLNSYSEERFVKDGDLLWNSTGLGTLGRIIVFKERYKDVYPQIVADSHVTVIRPSQFVVPDYLYYWFAGPTVQNEINAKASGSTKQTELATATVLDHAIPLPPLPEQHRIVAKVEELLALCDELEARQTTAREHRTRLVRSSFSHLTDPSTLNSQLSINSDHLTTAEDEADFQKHATFILHKSPFILEDLPALREAILSLAVKGGLQTKGDSQSSASKRLGDFAQLQNGYAFKSEWFVPNGIRLLRNANVGHGELRWIDSEFLGKTHWGEFERFNLSEGDIVLSLDRPFINTGTKVARVRKQDLPCLLLQRVGRFQPDRDRLHPDYLFLWLNSAQFSGQIDPGRSNGVPHISSKQVEAAQICLPPLAEQKRIVAKVDELMGWCDELERSLSAASTAGIHLLAALLQRILTR